MITLVALLLLAPSRAAPAQDSVRTLSGVTLPESVSVEGRELVLNGMALRKKFVVKVYVAGLYLAARSSDAEAILAADSPRRMVLQFLRGVDKGKMCGAWDESLENNTPTASDALKEQFATLCSYMADIKDGQQMVFTYLPETGTTIEVAGVRRGTIEGKDFADALFRSWIGPKPGPGEGFKKNVLGVKD
jgi:hypothetical protein